MKIFWKWCIVEKRYFLWVVGWASTSRVITCFGFFYPSVKTIFCARRHCQRVEKQIGSVRHTHISSQPVIFLSYLFGPCYPVMSSGSATVKSHLNKGKQGEKKIGSVRHTYVSSQPVILLSYPFWTSYGQSHPNKEKQIGSVHHSHVSS